MPDTTLPNIPDRDIFSVSRLVREARAVIEGSFPLLWLEGEISNYSRPSSGHMYFSLKDEAAQVRCAMFRNRNLHLRFKPENGMKVLVRAKISLYEARGEFQIIIEHMEEGGLGALQRAFEQLKNRLGKEGLFDAAHKKTPPSLPHQIGVITSPTGAAIRDILSVLKRRAPNIPVLIYPVAVQGDGAAAEITKAIQLANQRKECDVLLLARGGGSLEDLWAFNEEVVARAIYVSEIPIISGVGHEVDFTISDFVADRRAPTPSVAAEMVSPNREELLLLLRKLQTRLQNKTKGTLLQTQQQLNWLSKRLQQQHPGQLLQAKAQRLDELEQRLAQSISLHVSDKRNQTNHLGARLKQHSPLFRLNQLKSNYQHMHQRLQRAWQHALSRKQQQLLAASRTLHGISPLATLERGYAIVQRLPDYAVMTDAGTLKPGEKIETRLAKGKLTCTVEEIYKD